ARSEETDYSSAQYLYLHEGRSTLYQLVFLTEPPPAKIYTLSLHDALPISPRRFDPARGDFDIARDDRALDVLHGEAARRQRVGLDRKSTRLNSSHLVISYAVFCLKKKNVTHGEPEAADALRQAIEERPHCP